MTVLQERLKSIIEYTKQTALLKLSPQTTIAGHKEFAEHENALRGLPGLTFNPDASNENDEVWLRIERLQESKAPVINDPQFNVWFEKSDNPAKEPSLLSHIAGEKLIAVGALAVPKDAQNFDPKQLIALKDFAQKIAVQAQFDTYLETQWNPWAAEEKRRRKTITLYAKLFTLKQQLEGGIVDAQLELVWGIGIAVWKMADIHVSYPIITKLVELALDEKSMALEIRPRELDPRLELEIYGSVDNPSVGTLVKTGKDFFAKATATLSPYDRSTFEPLLRAAASNLDPKGIYWPTEVPADDRALPKETEELRVTDTWVLFARQKSPSVFLQDLDSFKKKLDEDDGEFSLPATVRALVEEPSSVIEDFVLSAFRGISMIGNDSGGESSLSKPQELFFPMPFNDEQVQIIQLLERSDGVVVQGPPGTGKTHTIANVICHYLANGKKVLVTSLRDPALTVLKEKLPIEIQSLAISVLTSEQEGMRQFEHAISKIAAEVQRINRSEYNQAIKRLETVIDGHHAQLAKIDSEINRWAERNLGTFVLDDETLEPRKVAEEVVGNQQLTSWLPDSISIGPEHRAQFDDRDITSLREARRVAGSDIDYLNAKVPELAAFPDSQLVLQLHQDLARSTQLRAEVETGRVIMLADNRTETLGNARQLSVLIDKLQHTRDALNAKNQNWIKAVEKFLREKNRLEIFALFEAIGEKVTDALRDKNRFLARPVFVPNNCDANELIFSAVGNLAEGKRPFGVAGIIGKSEEKKLLEQIRVVSLAPKSSEDWKHVLAYLTHLRDVRAVLTQWNPIVAEIGFPSVSINLEGLQKAEEFLAAYYQIKEKLTLEQAVASGCQQTMPTWQKIKEISLEQGAVEEAADIIQHHLTQSRLTAAWASRERLQQTVQGCTGRISEDIKAFFNNRFGSPNLSAADAQNNWSDLMGELRRVMALRQSLDCINDTTNRIQTSGAPLWAQELRISPAGAASDVLLPSNWQAGWRLKRLQVYLNSIDARHDLKRLGRLRTESARDLANAYREMIEKRTWLKLAENANPSVRNALQAFMTAIAKIGKGTGKRAVRFRQDARRAAMMANPAIPCWIMRHDRVSETLPPDFGCFDLVIIDEASQSDLTALPAILRAKKILIVGDDKQVSPEGVGLEESRIQGLMTQFLSDQVDIYRAQMSPDRSIYDLFKVVFGSSSVMLREHFRCASPIIEYSKREFYNHEIRPLRLPKASERLDPPLIDVLVEDGYRKNDINLGEARFIVDEVKRITSDPALASRSIGVVSLLADKQAIKVWQMIEEEIGLELIKKHKITCGDAKTFQGNERDIMFVSMVVSPGQVSASSRDMFRQRYNVAASRARDRMYLVRSVTVDDLSNADGLRRGLITHFSTPYDMDTKRVTDLRQLCESPFEKEVYDLLTERGYRVTPQVPVGQFRIDMVVEGGEDTRLAIECDGDQYHGLDQWENDMRRQRILERAGWKFWRCFASAFVMNREDTVADLLQTLHVHGIEPLGAVQVAISPFVEHRTICSAPLEAVEPANENSDEAYAPLLTEDMN